MKPGSAEERNFKYEGLDLVTLEKIVERDYRIPEPQTAQEVVGFHARRIAQDVKLPSQFGFAIEYTDSAVSLRYYEPDFVAVLGSGAHRLVETKGREDPDVAHKDRAAGLWCEDATALTGVEWRYVKVPQAGFERLEPTTFADLDVFG